MLELSPVLAASEQLHWTHIPIHGKLIQNIVQAVQAGQIDDPQRMLNTLQLVSEHVQEHIRFGGQQIGMEQQAKSAMTSLRSLAPIVRALTLMAQAADKEAKAAEQKQAEEMEQLRQQAEGQENAVKMHKIDSDAALEARKQDLNHQVQMAAAQNKSAIDALKARSKMDIESSLANMRRYVEAGKITGNPPPQTEGLASPEGL